MVGEHVDIPDEARYSPLDKWDFRWWEYLLLPLFPLLTVVVWWVGIARRLRGDSDG